MEKAMFEKGLSIRREVLGADYVDNAIKAADDFNRPLQELVTTYCWGEIWGRPGLDIALRPPQLARIFRTRGAPFRYQLMARIKNRSRCFVGRRHEIPALDLLLTFPLDLLG